MFVPQLIDIINLIATAIPVPTPSPTAIATVSAVATQVYETTKNSNTAEALNIGAFVTGSLAVVLGFIRIVLPAIGKRIAKSQEVKAEKDQLVLERDKAGDKFTIEAQSFMAEVARENLTIYKTQAQLSAEENKKLLVKIGNLEARDQINRAEIERLQKELAANQQSTVAAQVLLRDTQNEILKLQTQLITLKLELDNQTKRNDSIATQLITLKKKTSEIKPVPVPEPVTSDPVTEVAEVPEIAEEVKAETSTVTTTTTTTPSSPQEVENKEPPAVG